MNKRGAHEIVTLDCYIVADATCHLKDPDNMPCHLMSPLIVATTRVQKLDYARWLLIAYILLSVSIN